MDSNDLAIYGYLDGFEIELEKRGFLGLLAKTWLTRHVAKAMDDTKGEEIQKEPDIPTPSEFVAAQAPKLLKRIEAPTDEDILRETSRKADHELIDPKVEQLATRLGQDLPEELKDELERTKLMEHLKTQLDEKEKNGQVAVKSAGVFRY